MAANPNEYVALFKKPHAPQKTSVGCVLNSIEYGAHIVVIKSK